MKISRLALISLGCAKNLVNSEQMAHLLTRAGHSISPDIEGADAVIVNTCGFIEDAKREAIDLILELAERKAQGETGKIIVCGCLAQRYRDDFLKELPEVDAIVGTGSFGEIEAALRGALEGETPELFGDISAPVEETARLVSTGPGWAYVKIAEGCDNRCAYCVIPDLRGGFRSRPMENIIDEAGRLIQNGVRELILVAQDVTRYGTDIYGRPALPELLRRLCAIDGAGWIRLHYLYPDEIDGELIETVASEDKILKYLDIPIQHINSGILAKMNRRGDGGMIRRLFKELREKIPGVVLRSSLITGLPGEGEAEFEELCDFLREAKIERAGVFPYSPEEGTPAEKMPGRPDIETARRRAELIMELQADIMEEFNRARIGGALSVLCQDFDGERGMWQARSFAESPDIDGVIWLSGAGEPGRFFKAVITGEENGELMGEIISEALSADEQGFSKEAGA